LSSVVSVIIPAYNSARLIGAALDSALAQTYPHLEIVVVNDGSTDETEAVLKPYRDRIRYVHQNNQGLGAARNAGLQASTGEFVAWLDSDDLWNPEKIAVQMAFMLDHPDHVVIASDFSAFDEDGFFELSHVANYYSVLRRTPGGLGGFFPQHTALDVAKLQATNPDLPERISVYHGEAYAKLIGGNCLHPPTVLFRRSAANRAGRQDGAFRKDVDYEYLLRLAHLGPVAFVDRPLMRYRYSGDQMSSDKHLVDIVLSRLLVLDSLKAQDPALADDRGFRDRLGGSHLGAANALAESRAWEALRHLLQSVAWGHVGMATVRAAAKVLVPNWVLGAYRQRRTRA